MSDMKGNTGVTAGSYAGTAVGPKISSWGWEWECSVDFSGKWIWYTLQGVWIAGTPPAGPVIWQWNVPPVSPAVTVVGFCFDGVPDGYSGTCTLTPPGENQRPQTWTISTPCPYQPMAE